MSKLINDNRFYRRGPDHRGGWIVGFADIKKHFGFKTLQIGKWVTKAEKEFTAPLFFDALSDLQLILGAPVQLISLRETLSLNYGKGGQYGVMAHYAPATQTFALAKNAGPGAIAHEWFHAFDHYIAEKFIQKKAVGLFATEQYWNGAKIKTHPLNEKLAVCFDTIFYADSKANPSEYVRASLHVDEAEGQRYFSLPYELAARAFEAYVQDASVKNNFLSKGTQKSKEAEMGLYPKGEHRLKINAAFQQYFQHLGYLLHQENERVEK